MRNKKLNFRTLTLTAMLLLLGFTTSEVLAQRGQGKGYGRAWKDNDRGFCMNLPDMSDDQKEKIADLRTAFMKKSMEVRNKIDVASAELKMISTGDEVDQDAVNKKIDEITDLKASLMKEHAAHRQEVRSLLTDEQKVIFDQHGPGHGMGMGYGPKHRMGKGHCMGPCGKGGYGPNCQYRNYDEDDD